MINVNWLVRTTANTKPRYPTFVQIYTEMPNGERKPCAQLLPRKIPVLANEPKNAIVLGS